MKAQDLQKLYHTHRRTVERRLASLAGGKKPLSVYEPMAYVLAAGGKRLRAVLVLLACEAVGGQPRRALDAAVAVELLHNFTLIHDDVMDHADLRRGKPTVHKKWDENVAILAGDEMIAYAYAVLLKTKSPRLDRVLNAFTDAFAVVCEGQGYDKEFEERRDVRVAEYLMMIGKKTAHLLAAATVIGGWIGGGSRAEIDALRRYGTHLGLAFQFQDDLLDISGDEEETGKAVGGDVMEGKKTFLLLKALERAKGSDRTLLRSIAPRNGMTRGKVGDVLRVYERTGVLDDARREVARHTRRAQRALEALPQNRATAALFRLSGELLARHS